MKRVRIGLMRHFEVRKPMPDKWLTSSELMTWLDGYNQAEVIARPLDLGGIAWQKCYSSNLSRAFVTAQAAFSGEIEQRAELREAEVHPFGTGGLRLPILAWQWVLRLAWYSSHASQRQAKATFMARVSHVSTEILDRAEGDILIVSHAGMMSYLRKELMAKGFKGPKYSIAQNGQFYVFEKTTPS